MGHSRGYLSDFFDGVAIKRLSVVEADAKRSNQHEFNGVEALKKIMGVERQDKLPTKFMWVADEEDDRITSPGFLTWYDSRENHPTRSEYRLYFPSNLVLSNAVAGDLVFFCRQKNGHMLTIVVPQKSSMEMQLLWLFGIDDPGTNFESTGFSGNSDVRLGFAARFILDEIGLESEEPEDNFLDSILEKFGPGFPQTSVFSAFARETLKDVSPVDDPDHALIAWMQHEERLFRTLERHQLAERLTQGFILTDGPDVDGFISFSLSVQNRRKSRVGRAFENHLEAILQQHKIRYERGALTENRARPDFLFPGSKEYQDRDFSTEKLFMLGVKTTCKDRWRQVTSEAKKIERKHLLTLEPGISEFQTDEMRSHGLQLVVPEELHETYQAKQQSWLINLKEFINIVSH